MPPSRWKRPLLVKRARHGKTVLAPGSPIARRAAPSGTSIHYQGECKVLYEYTLCHGWLEKPARHARVQDIRNYSARQAAGMPSGLRAYERQCC